jgi:hypothetical protein
MRRDFGNARFAVDRFHEHQAGALEPEIELRPVGHGVNVAARHEVFVADLAGRHARDAGDQVAGAGARVVIGHLVDHLVTVGPGAVFKRLVVGVKAGEVAEAFLVTRSGAGEFPLSQIDGKAAWFGPQHMNHSSVSINECVA